MTTDDIKPKGGRGKRAGYVTVQVRCPEPIKAAVVNLINQWHLGETNSQSDQQKNLNTTIEKLTLELKQEKAWVEALKESHKKTEAVRDETLSNLAAELGNAEREIKRLTELNKNLNTTIEELRKQNNELEKVRDENGVLAYELKLERSLSKSAIERKDSDVSSLSMALQQKIDENSILKNELGKIVKPRLNLNTSINPEAINILENALTLKANAGGKIKDAIKQALKLLK